MNASKQQLFIFHNTESIEDSDSDEISEEIPTEE